MKVTGRTERRAQSSQLPLPGGSRGLSREPEGRWPVQMSTETAHKGAAEGIPGPSQEVIRAEGTDKQLPALGNHSGGVCVWGGGEDKEGLRKQQLCANFPTDILWVFAIRNNSITTYVKGF